VKLSEIHRDTDADELFQLQLAVKRLKQLGLNAKLNDLVWAPDGGVATTQNFIEVRTPTFSVNMFHSTDPVAEWENVWFNRSGSRSGKYVFSNFRDALKDLEPLMHKEQA